MSKRIYTATVTKTWTEPVAASSPEEAEAVARECVGDFDSVPTVEVGVTLAGREEFGSALPWNGEGGFMCSEFFSSGTVVFILGPPGCGKGTQAALLSERLGLPHISTGDCLREEIAAGTELGKKIEPAFHRGELMESQDMIQVVRNRLAKPDCLKGAIIDGGARTVDEARDYLEAGILTDLIWMNAPDSMCIERVKGRVIDPVTKLAYHLEHNPPPTDVASRCEKRSMDAKAAERLEIYHQTTKPVFRVVAEYPDAHLHTLMIDPEWDIETTYEKMTSIVQSVLRVGDPYTIPDPTHVAPPMESPISPRFFGFESD